MPRARPVPLNPEDQRVTLKYTRLQPPGWDEIIHLRPDWILPPGEALKRKRERAIRISRSPETKFSRSAVWLMTMIDRSQNILAAGSLGLRIASIAIPVLRPLAVLTGKASDWTNVFGLMRRTIRLPAAGKREAEARFRQAPGYYEARAKNVTNLRSALPAVAEVIQLLHTSDYLTGVGLSFGALMGTPMAAMATLVKEPSQLNPLPLLTGPPIPAPEETEDVWQHRYDRWQQAAAPLRAVAVAAIVSVMEPSIPIMAIATEILGHILPRPTQQDLKDYRAAAEGLEATTWLSTAPDILTPHEHILIALAHYACLETLNQIQSGPSLAQLAVPFLDNIYQAGRPKDPMLRQALQDANLDPDHQPRLPLEGSPARASMRDIQAELQEIAPPVLAQWREAVHTEEQEVFTGALHTHAATAWIKPATGHDPEITHSYSPTARAILTLMDNAVPLPDNIPDIALGQVVDQLAQTWFGNDGHQPPPDQVRTDFSRAIHDLQTAPQHVRE